MAVNREQFREFLTMNSINEVKANEVMAELNPFFQQAESGPFVFGQEPDQQAACQAIALATGREVRQVIFISVANPLPEPDWMSNDYESSLHASLGFSLHASLGSSLHASLWASLECNLLYYAGFILAGDEKLASKFVPLLQLSAANPVLAEKADEPGVWFALKA